MLSRLASFARPSLPRSVTRRFKISTMPASIQPENRKKPQDRSNLITFSPRLKEGRALAQDVWSIYKCVHCTKSGQRRYFMGNLALLIFLQTALILVKVT